MFSLLNSPMLLSFTGLQLKLGTMHGAVRLMYRFISAMEMDLKHSMILPETVWRSAVSVETEDRFFFGGSRRVEI